MVNWTEVQAVATVALVATSAGAIAYAALQLRHERDYRSVANLEKQLGFFLSEGFLAARRKLAVDRMDGEELKPLDKDDPPVSVFEVLDFYEHLGLLVKKGHLNIYDVWHTFYEWAQPVYADLRPMIEDPESSYIDHYWICGDLIGQMDSHPAAAYEDAEGGPLDDVDAGADPCALQVRDRDRRKAAQDAAVRERYGDTAKGLLRHTWREEDGDCG